MLASRHGAMALALRLTSETANGIAAIDICRASMLETRSRRRIQKPRMLNVRRRLPRRLSTIRSPTFSAELP